MKPNYRALTSLRFFAATAVVCFHYVPGITAFSVFPHAVQNLIQRGSIALCFFFVLSGFVLATSYQDKTIDTSATRRSFWLARFARLYPAYLFAFVLFLPMALHKYILDPVRGNIESAHITFVASAILSSLLIQSWTRFSQPWNGPGWSLSVEAFFYFLFPFIAFKLMRQRTVVAVSFCAVLWFWSLLTVYVHMIGVISDQFYTSYVCYHPLFWTPCFLAGIVLQRFTVSWQRLPSNVSSVLLLLAVLAVILTCMLVPQPYDGFLITTGALPLLGVVILSCSHSSSRLVRYIGSSPLYELGDISYVIYILQGPLWHYVGELTNQLEYVTPLFRQGSALHFLLFFSVLLCTSYLASRYVERPTRTWLLQRLTRHDRAGIWGGASVGSVQG